MLIHCTGFYQDRQPHAAPLGYTAKIWSELFDAGGVMLSERIGKRIEVERKIGLKRKNSGNMTHEKSKRKNKERKK